MFKAIGEIRIFGERKKVKVYLTVLSSGLILCPIQVINPQHPEEFVTCNSLVDTGSEVSVVCKTIFDSFKTYDSKKQKGGISTANMSEENVLVYPLTLKVPENNWRKIDNYFWIKQIDRPEYKVILGMDVLRNFDLIYKGTQGLAWIDD